MKKILLFQVENPLKVKQAVATMRLRVESVPTTNFQQTIDSLINGECCEQEIKEHLLPKESLLLMCGLTSGEVDQVLSRLRSQKIRISYKAVLTPTNRNWNVYELYEEMEKEKKAIEAKINKSEGV